MSSLIFAVSALIGACGVHAWSGNAHLVIAQVARDELKAAGLESVLDVLGQILNETSPFFPGSSSFVTTATWSDDLMWRDGNGMFASWHFINKDFNDFSPNASQAPQNQTLQAQDNVWGTLKWCNESLQALDADPSPAVRGKTFLASFCLRWLIHVVGDVHQPLHCTQRVNAQFPRGDLGGNLCLINRTEKNLHALWDQGAGLYGISDFEHPPTRAQFATIHKQADLLRSTWPRKQFPNTTVDLWNFREWIEESYDAGVHIAYQNGSFVCNDSLPLSAAYVQAVIDTSEQRMALAAYRLVDLLIKIVPRTYTELLPAYCVNITQPGFDIVRFDFSRTILCVSIAGVAIALVAMLFLAYCIGKRRASGTRVTSPYGFERLP
jgi:hypothetical protein